MARNASKREADAPVVEAHRRVAFAGPSEYGMDEEAQAAEDALLLSYNEHELAWLMGTNVTRYRRYLEITGQLAENLTCRLLWMCPIRPRTRCDVELHHGQRQNEPSSYSYQWQLDGVDVFLQVIRTMPCSLLMSAGSYLCRHRDQRCRVYHGAAVQPDHHRRSGCGHGGGGGVRRTGSAPGHEGRKGRAAWAAHPAREGRGRMTRGFGQPSRRLVLQGA